MTTSQRSSVIWPVRGVLLALIGDAIIISVAYSAALALRFEGAIPSERIDSLKIYLGPVVIGFLLSNALFGIYRQLWRYASAQEVASIALSTALPSGLIIIVELIFFETRPIPLSVVIIGWFLTAGWLTLARYRSRLFTGLSGRFERMIGSSSSRERVLIVGAGDAGQMVARQLLQPETTRRYEIVGYIDDDPTKIGRRVMGGTVLASREHIATVAEQRAVDLIVIAILRIRGKAIRDIITHCENTDARLKVIPRSAVDFERAGTTITLEDIQPEDLMGRAAVPLDLGACQNLVEGRRVLVTGAAGSIGSELCRQLAAFAPEVLVMVDVNESGLYDLSNEIQRIVQAELHLTLADISDKMRLEQTFSRFKPQVVFHAAAYKHVPMLEEFPEEAIRVNVLGTRNVIGLCKEHGVEQVAIISTDKAVNPSNVMGATKLISEQMIVAQPADGVTKFAMVRFGNVINSRGSVVPIFMRQIENGEPITITDPNVTRFFMSIPEAVSLVIQAATLSDGNDLFLLDMGEPLLIEDLARKLIRMHGLRMDDVKFNYTGLRPGEKLSESLTADYETVALTSSEKIFRITTPKLFSSTLYKMKGIVSSTE